MHLVEIVTGRVSSNGGKVLKSSTRSALKRIDSTSFPPAKPCVGPQGNHIFNSGKDADVYLNTASSVGLNKSTCLHDVIISEIILYRGEIHHLWNIPQARAQGGLTYGPWEPHTLIKPDNGEK